MNDLILKFKTQKTQRFNPQFLKLEFKKVYKNGIERPLCVICGDILSVESMKPKRLREHLEGRHKEFLRYTEEMFQETAERFRLHGALDKFNFKPISKAASKASYQMAELLAQECRPHTDGVNLIKKGSATMAMTICGEEVSTKFNEAPLRNKTMKRRISDMSIDIEDQAVQDLRESAQPFSRQLDESTDEASCCQLLAYVRYVKEVDIKEEFLFCSPMKSSEDILGVINSYFIRQTLDWSKVGSVCTEGAPVMVGKNSGFAALVLHRHALAVKMLPKNLKDVMGIVISTVNYIRSRALQHRLFQQLCEEMGAEYTHLLYYTEVRWLSRGHVIGRVLSLKDQMALFYSERDIGLASAFEDSTFTVRLTSLSDIFSELNRLNRNLQGSGITIVEAGECINAMKEKIENWLEDLSEGVFFNFPKLSEILVENNTEDPLKNTVKEDVTEHLKILLNKLKGYFSDVSVKPWISDNFSSTIKKMKAKDNIICEYRISKSSKYIHVTETLCGGALFCTRRGFGHSLSGLPWLRCPKRSNIRFTSFSSGSSTYPLAPNPPSLADEFSDVYNSLEATISCDEIKCLNYSSQHLFRPFTFLTIQLTLHGIK